MKCKRMKEEGGKRVSDGVRKRKAEARGGESNYPDYFPLSA